MENKCKNCRHFLRFSCESYMQRKKVFFRCAILPSSKTAEGLLNIRANQPPCDLYEKVMK